MQIRPLNPLTDRAAVAALLTEAQDYYRLWLGRAPGPEQVEAVFTAGPPGCDPAKSHRLGLYLRDPNSGEAHTGLSGVAELSFGFPQPNDAYLGLMVLAPYARSQGHGAAFPAHIESLTLPHPHLYLAVLEANSRGMVFWRAHGFTVTGITRHDE